jgi:hypothetical protein
LKHRTNFWCCDVRDQYFLRYPVCNCGEPELVDAAMPASAPLPIFPPKPVIKPAIAPMPAPVAVTAPQPAPPPAVATAPEKPANAEALQSLLVSLKQELMNAAQI